MLLLKNKMICADLADSAGGIMNHLPPFSRYSDTATSVDFLSVEIAGKRVCVSGFQIFNVISIN